MKWFDRVRNRAKAGAPEARVSAEAYRIVEMIARDESLEVVLGELANTLEQEHPGAICAVSVLRNARLCFGAAPSLPESYVRAVDGLALGAAPFWSHSPFLSELRTDPRWAGFRGELLDRNLRSCYSLPIVSGAGEILGSLSVFRQEVRQPSGDEMEAMQLAGRLAGIAIEHRNLTDELAYQAHHDPLTRLPNRRLFEDRLRQAISLAQRNGQMTAMLYMDLDRFKLVNDLLGHSVGDILLELVARRLEDRLRRSDSLARSGGDEFTVLLPSLGQADGAEKVAQDLLRALSTPFQVAEHELFVTASIGVSVYPLDGPDAAALERNAVSAMYSAKRQGRNNAQRFSPEMTAVSADRLELEVHLRRALSREEFFVEYQPQIDLAHFRVCGVEALVRWKHPLLGIISPGTFIPIAEESGLIIPIGGWVLEQACRQAREWQRSGQARVRVAVNVSALQFTRPEFVEFVRAVLAQTGLDAQFLELELTESTIMRDVDKAACRMDQLRELGARIAIDDFGTGHSSLSYLQRLPVDTIKIDQSFIRELADASDRPPLLQTIVSLAHRLGKRIVAEGVETQAQLEALRRMECDEAQGYLFGKTWSPELSERPLVPAAAL